MKKKGLTRRRREYLLNKKDFPIVKIFRNLIYT